MFSFPSPHTKKQVEAEEAQPALLVVLVVGRIPIMQREGNEAK